MVENFMINVLAITASAQMSDIILICMATIGGAARYTDRYLNHKETPVLTRVPLHLFVSAFAGYMCAQLAMTLNADLAWVSAGLGGFAGTKSLDFISGVITKRLGISESIKSTEKPTAPKSDES